VNLRLALTAGFLAILLAFSAFFSASETSLTSISKVQLRKLRKGRSRRERLLVRLLSDPGRMLTTLLIGNNLVNNWASSIATAFAIGLVGEGGVALATAAMTVIILVFGEITPKTVAARRPEALALRLAPAVGLVQRILYPLVIVFTAINSFFIAILRSLSPDKDRRLTEDELRTMVDLGKREGALEEGEHTLLNRAFDFNDLRMRELMVPRTRIAALPSDAGLAVIREAFVKYRFSRLPVYGSSLDDIRGMIHYKDLLFALESGAGTSAADLARPVLFVPETQTTYELLRELERNGQNMAVAVDEHGATAGLVTIDDAIAAVFGCIRDEYDIGSTVPADRVQLVDSHHLHVPGDLRLSDLNALVKTALESDYYETVGGYVLETAGRLPVKGECVRRDHVRFIVEEVSSRKIQRVFIIIEDRERTGKR